MSVRVKVFVAITAVAAITAGSVVAAIGADSGLIFITGHVRNAYGQPLFACVKAASSGREPLSLVRSTEGLTSVDEEYVEPTVDIDGRAFTKADGSYSLAVPPGTYEIRAVDALVSGLGPSCWGEGGLYAPTTLTVDTLRDFEPTDFTLSFNVSAYAYVPPEGLTAFRPNQQVTLLASVSKSAGDATATWTDETSGTVIFLTRTESTNTNFGPQWTFEGLFTVPADRPDGEYQGVFDIEVAGVPGAAEEVVLTSVVDTVSPVISATFPADGATNIRPQLSLAIWPQDSGSGFTCIGNSRLIYHLPDLGEPTLVQPVWSRPPQNYLGGCGNSDFYALEMGEDYRAEFTVRDRAGNWSQRTAAFTTGLGHLFFGESPSGTTQAPVSRIQVRADTGIDFRRVHFKIGRLLPAGVSVNIDYQNLYFDIETRTFWIELDKIDPENLNRTLFHKPPLTPGNYRATIDDQRDVTGNHLDDYTWDFEVTA